MRRRILHDAITASSLFLFGLFFGIGANWYVVQLVMSTYKQALPLVIATHRKQYYHGIAHELTTNWRCYVNADTPPRWETISFHVGLPLVS